MRNAGWRLRVGLALKDPWFTLNVRAHAREAVGPYDMLTIPVASSCGLCPRRPLCGWHASAVLRTVNDHHGDPDHDDHQ